MNILAFDRQEQVLGGQQWSHSSGLRWNRATQTLFGWDQHLYMQRIRNALYENSWDPENNVNNIYDM
eukprot:750480-Hanusia_phi.AAC.14